MEIACTKSFSCLCDLIRMCEYFLENLSNVQVKITSMADHVSKHGKGILYFDVSIVHLKTNVQHANII